MEQVDNSRPLSTCSWSKWTNPATGENRLRPFPPNIVYRGPPPLSPQYNVGARPGGLGLTVWRLYGDCMGMYGRDYRWLADPIHPR